MEECCGRGAHMALLHRRIEDARAVGARELFAVTEESLECPQALSTGARSLLRAGCRLLEVRDVWQPPAELIAAEGDEEDDWGDGPDDDRLDEDAEP